MTDHFTCPRCSWPQGPVASDPYEALVMPHYPVPAWFTDAKEGEEDGHRSNNKGCADTVRNERHDRDFCADRGHLENVTHDIAGLVERLREWGVEAKRRDTLLLINEAASALERMESKLTEQRAITIRIHNERATMLVQNAEELAAAKAEIAQQRAYKEAHLRGWDAAKAEIERLRAALEKIANTGWADDAIIQCARAALTGRGE